MALFDEQSAERRPLGITLLAALYLFFLLVSASTFGNPFPFFGQIYFDAAAKFLVLFDTLLCLYLFLGITQQQLLTWYLLLGYNLLQISNTVINLNYISLTEVETISGGQINSDSLWTNNMIAVLGLLLLSQYIYRHKRYFANATRYLF